MFTPQGRIGDPSIQQRVHYSENVAVGTVTEITDDPDFQPGHGYTKAAKVVIRCSYKGEMLPRTIKIRGVGKYIFLCVYIYIFLEGLKCCTIQALI